MKWMSGKPGNRYPELRTGTGIATGIGTGKGIGKRRKKKDEMNDHILLGD